MGRAKLIRARQLEGNQCAAHQRGAHAVKNDLPHLILNLQLNVENPDHALPLPDVFPPLGHGLEKIAAQDPVFEDVYAILVFAAACSGFGFIFRTPCRIFWGRNGIFSRQRAVRRGFGGYFHDHL
jgi:hypothetical protein